MSKNTNPKGREGKMSFARELITRQNNRLTRKEAAAEFLLKYPNCGKGTLPSAQTASNTIAWAIGDLYRKKLGHTVTIIELNSRAAKHGEREIMCPSPMTPTGLPPVEELVERALAESNRKGPESYGSVIGILRDNKGFSFKAIADWLTDNGVDADYNAVYRVYTKGKPEDGIAG